ncbi:peptidylprolyl isomerase [Arenibacter sp. N53]|uniref:FKBP-type peptidyl-prolyl cis-trans isomerase n=1 Tax=Arenibacter TaxID=178469 RepID=UPI000CD3B794|nr:MULTISPECIES: peptidylprolyl isomerase [Arenibacter]MCM4152371.1 peptidylprolyl isomerase [Arenibacter sp. N53]
MSKAKVNDTVKVHYTGKLKTGEIFDSSLERDPLEVTLGQGQLIPGFEKELVDMEINEKKTITVPKEEAYGDIVEDMFHEIKKAELPEDIKPEIGMMLVAKNPDGTENQLRISDIKEETIVIDANHVLAGQDLTFELELVAIL